MKDALAGFSLEHGVWAAGVVIVAAIWRTFAIGQRLGRLLERVERQGQDIEYIRDKLDEHMARGDD